MKKKIYILRNFRRHLSFVLVWLSFSAIHAASIGLNLPQHPQGVVPIVPKAYPGLSQYYHDSTLVTSPFSQYKRVFQLDSSDQILEIREMLYEEDYYLPVAMDLEYYVQQRLELDRRERWRETVLKNLSKKEERDGQGIELNIPVRIKSKAFQRIFGGDQVGLRVTGNISFELAGRSENREGSAVSSYEQRGNFAPRFKQTQQFQVEGKVGDKVSVKVDQNSEATFDFENTLRLNYTGHEDEIIQSIDAGNVNLSIPRTNYVSASTKHQGLFGLKTDMKVGNLSFTGIASLQRGEKEKITKTGQAAENTFRIKDYEYVRNRFFFVDKIYAENFESGYDPQTMTWQVFANGSYRITQLDVWKQAQPTNEEARPGWAVLDPSQVNPDSLDQLTFQPGVRENAYFVRLEPGKDYYYDEYRGFFWLNQNLDDQDILAVSYETDGGVKRGMLFNEITDSTTTLLLKLVHAQGSKPQFPTWNLTMRNVYNLGSANISPEGFDVKILYTKTGEDVDIQPFGERKSFIYLMGLDRLDEQGNFIDGGDKKVDVNNGNLFMLGDGYLVFPTTMPFAPPENSPFAIDDSLSVNIYDIKDRQKELERHKFDIEITTSSSSSNFDLGFNVLEGSEVVKLNGRVLEKEKDYTIDYFSGTLQILAPEARRADANIEIEYERGSIFQLDKKTLLGGRLEYAFGDRGFIGMTGLYLNKSTLDQRVRLGQEPLRNFVWDVNTAFDFKPNFITSVLDFLPVMETSAESKLEVEAEYAQVNPNPNTFNEEDLGENNGVAYIDDFEGSERTTPLGIIYRGWSPASIPVRFSLLNQNVDYQIDVNNDSSMYRMDANRLHMFWYNPFNQVPIRDIWPNKDVNAQTGTTTNVLVLKWKNQSVPRDSAWGGIMRSTVNFPDQKKTKFIELWVNGTVGQVNVDMGKVSEDYYIRKGTLTFDGRKSLGNLNTEDKNLNGLLDADEDVGLDGVPDGDPVDDPLDNWRAPQETTPNFFQINGTEGNGEAKGAKYPDTEDLDGDGGLDRTNEYFSYQFNLADSSHPYIKGRTEKGWRLYRIPIRNYDPEKVVGNPDTTFQEIYYLRLWINDLPPDDQYHAIQIAAFDLVGNEWEEEGVAKHASSPFIPNDSLFSIAVYNDVENVEETPGGPEAYHSPPNVTGIRDRITKAKSKEQSLVMQLNYLEPGARAEANKQLYEKMNLIHYKKLKMFVHGDWNLPQENTPLEFYMRFGPADQIYYEIGGNVYPHWDPRNHVEVVLDELAKTKDRKYLTGDTLNGRPVYFRRDPDNPEKYYRVVGEPSLRNINFINIGARNVGNTPIQGMEIWLDEMRVTDVERDKGTAMRLSTNLSMADVATLRAQWEVVEADFRHIESQFGSGNTTEKQHYRLGLKLNKFFPSSWGLQIPVSGGLVKTRNIPKYFYNSDKLTKYKPQGFADRISQFFGLSELDPELEKNSRITESKSLGATIQRKSSPRTPWYLRYTIDQMTLDVDWTQKHSSSERDLFNDDQSISAQFQMGLPFGKNNFIKPFGWLGNGPIVRRLASEKLYYTPSNVGFNVSIRDNESERQARLEDKPTRTVKTTSSRSVNMNYTLFPSLSFNVKRDYQSDAYQKGYRVDDLVNAIFTKFDFGLDKNINQNFNVNYSPKFFSWLNQNFKYTSGFNYNFGNVRTNDRSSRLQVSKQVSLGLQPSALANKIYRPKPKTRQQQGYQRRGRGGEGTGGPRRQPPQSEEPPSPEEGTTPPGEGTEIPPRQEGAQPPQEEEGIKKPPEPPQSEQEQEKPQEPQAEPQKEEPQKIDDQKQQEPERKRPSISLPNPAILLWKFFDSWKSINLDYRLTDNYSYFNVDGIPTIEHQLGFSTNPGVGTDTSHNKLPRAPAIKNSKNISASLNFDFVRNLQSSFKYNYAKDLNQNNQQKTENISSTVFFMGDDPEANKKDWWALIPDWQLRLTGVEKWFFFSNFAQTIQLEHQRSGKFNESNRYDETGKTRDRWGYSNSYSPLLGISINTKWGITGNIRYTKTTTFNYQFSGGDTKSQSSGFDMTFSFSKSGGFTIPLPFLKDKRLKNEMQFNLNVSQSNNVSFAKRPGSGSVEFIEQDKNSSFKLRPSVNYRFSQKVNGSMFFEYSSSKNKRTGKYSYFEFGINVNIAIR